MKLQAVKARSLFQIYVDIQTQRRIIAETVLFLPAGSVGKQVYYISADKINPLIG